MALDFPNSPTVGQIFTGGMGSWQWDGQKWVPNSAGTGTVTISDTPPASPTVGSFWFDSVGVQLYVYYNDGNSSQWVPANNQALGGFLALAGGTMTGPLTLAGAATAANQPVTLAQLHTLPTMQRFTSGSGTYTPAAGVAWIRVRMVAGGGGGGGVVSGAPGTVGGNTSFGAWTTIGGGGGGAGVATPGVASAGPGGGQNTSGANGTGTLVVRVAGGDGAVGPPPIASSGNYASGYALGGSSYFSGVSYGVPGATPVIGAGGPGAGSNNSGASQGGGGGAGEYVEFLVNAPAALAYSVGAGGAGGTGTYGGFVGAPGVILVEEHY